MLNRPILTVLVPCLCAAAQAADTPPIELHGFVSQGYLKTSRNNYLGDTQNGSFEFNEAALSAQTQLAPDLRAGLQLFARDLGSIGNDRVGIDWAYVDYRWRDELGLRVGIVKVARGLYNECFDLDAVNPTVMLPQTVYDQRLRDFLVSTEGVSAYGTIGAGSAGSCEYELFCGTKSLENDGSVAGFFRNAVYSSTTDYEISSMSLERMYGGSLTWSTPLHGLRVNGSCLRFDHLVSHGDLIGVAPVPVPAVVSVDRGRNATMGAEYSRGPLRLAGEYTMWNFDYDIAGTTGISRWGGWYGQAAYRLHPQWEVAATYGEFYNDRTDRDGHANTDPRSGFQHDASLSLRFDPREEWSIKAEVHWIRGWALMFGQDNPQGFSGDTWMFACDTTVSF
jgi:hypothetical protein